MTHDAAINYGKPSPHEALEIPDILRILFRQGQSPRDLARCARVCRQWSKLALEALWQDYQPPIHMMCDMHRVGQLSKYVPMIKNLNIRLDLKAKARLKSWYMPLDVFSTARAVSLSVKLVLGDVKTKHLRYLIQWHLRRAVFCEGTYGDEFLELLASQAPRLEELSVDNRAPEMLTPECLHSFLLKMPHLRKISGLLWDVSDDTIALLAERKNLEHLSFYGFESPDWLNVLETVDCDHAAFASLQGLEARSPNLMESDVPRMLPFFHNLRKLRLSLDVLYSVDSVIASLELCPQLTHLQLTLNLGERFRESTAALDPERLFAAFSACQELREVEIQCFAFRFQSYAIKPDDLCRLFSALPKIRTLCLPLNCRVGVAEIRAIQKCCPNLESLRLKGSVMDYAELYHCSDPPVLPRMKQFLSSEGHRDSRCDFLPMPSSNPGQPEKPVQVEILRHLVPRVAVGRHLYLAKAPFNPAWSHGPRFQIYPRRCER